MKKNKMMRIASVLLVAVLLSTCAIFGTFAKYTTSVTSQDSARVAYWGFQSSNSIDITGLFATTYGNVKAQNEDGSFVTNEHTDCIPAKITQPGYTDKWKECVAKDNGKILESR